MTNLHGTADDYAHMPPLTSISVTTYWPVNVIRLIDAEMARLGLGSREDVIAKLIKDGLIGLAL